MNYLLEQDQTLCLESYKVFNNANENKSPRSRNNTSGMI